MPQILTLVSHYLCPYVQRAAIVASEKDMAMSRTFIDLADKPAWFTAISPTGKVPLLKVTDENNRQHVLFESAPIAEYLDEIGPGPRLMPNHPLEKARTRAWVEFASAILSDIAGLYSAQDKDGFDLKRAAIMKRLAQIELEIRGDWFMERQFGLIEVAFAPIFRYFDVFEEVASINLTTDLPKVGLWRQKLGQRPSVIAAVSSDYDTQLRAFLLARKSYLSAVIEQGQHRLTPPQQPPAAS